MDQKTGPLCQNPRWHNLAETRAYRQLHADLGSHRQLDKGWGQIATPLSVQTAGGSQKLNCANTGGSFRIIQSIPSPKAEPFKRWLAKAGYERVQEIEDPELGTKRTRELYKAKGYPDDWIEKRMRAIAIREELTEEWKNRSVKEDRDYAILTAEISKAAFGIAPSWNTSRSKVSNARIFATT